MAAVLAFAVVFSFWLERDLIFGSDEYLWLELAGLGDLGSYFHPYGGHLILVPFLSWRLLLDLFGTDFTAFSIVQVIGLTISAALLYTYAKRRIGPILALSPMIMLLFAGTGWSPLMQPMIGMQFLFALVPGLAAMLALEREDLRGDIGACVLLCVAMASFSEAAAFLAGAAVAVALAPNWRRRAWVVVIPGVLYFAWHLWGRQFGAEPIELSSVPWLLTYISDSLGVIASSIFGQSYLIGSGHWTLIRLQGYDFNQLTAGIVIAMLEGLLVWRAFWLLRRRVGGIPRSVWAPIVILVTLWILQGLVFNANRTPAEIRYIYAGTLLLLMVVAEMLRGVRTTWLTVTVAAVLTAAAVVGNIPHFREGRQALYAASITARADMAVIELDGHHIGHTFTPNIDAADIVDSGLSFNTGPWLKVTKRFGSPAYSLAQLAAADEPVRVQADQLAARALEPMLEPVERAPRKGCKQFGTPDGGQVDVALPAGGAVLTASRASPVKLRRWADEFSIQLGKVAAGEPVALRLPADKAAVPWMLRFKRGGSIDVCSP